MSDENVVVTEVKSKGDRGELGEGTPGLRLKTLWAAAGKPCSLKQFVRGLKDNADVKTWRDNKLGKNNQKTTDANKAMAKLCSAATKLSRKKDKSGGKKA